MASRLLHILIPVRQATIENEDKKLYGIQFHPEVNHTENGVAMLRNFLYNVCGFTGDWSMENYVKTAIADIRAKVGDKKVLLAPVRRS